MSAHVPSGSHTSTARRAARSALAMEAKGWESLFRWIARKPDIPSGATGFGYSAPLMPILIVFIVLSAVEIPILDLILHPWPVPRIIALVLGVWGVTFMLGMLAGFRVNPHVVGPDGLRIRSGTRVDIPIAWDDVESIRLRRHGLESSRAIQVTGTDDAKTLHVVVQSETGIELALRRPITVSLPSGAAVNFYADDPAALIARARELLESGTVPDAR